MDVLSLLRIAGSRLVSFQRQYGYLWPERVRVPGPGPEGISYERISLENLEKVRTWKGPLVVRRFRALLKRGLVGLYALHDGRVVGFLWAAVRCERGFPLLCHELIEPGEAMSGRAEVLPEYRRQKVGFHIHAEMQKLLRSLYGNRIARMWGVTGVDNEPMQKLASALGCTRLREQVVLGLLGLVFFSALWPLAPDTERRVGRPRLALRLRVPDWVYALR